MRITDAVFRRGHLSEDALTEAILSGQHPEHLAACEDCSRRSEELGRWLDDVRAMATDAADDAFPPEKLALQQAQILRRLEQLDEPSRVIAFPAQAIGAPRSGNGRRVAPAWVGVAAAAGLVIGVIGGQFSARLASPAAMPSAPQQTSQPAGQAPLAGVPENASLLDYDLERHIPDALAIYDEMTPTLLETQYAVAR